MPRSLVALVFIFRRMNLLDYGFLMSWAYDKISPVEATFSAPVRVRFFW